MLKGNPARWGVATLSKSETAPACRSFFRCDEGACMSFSAMAWASQQLPECAHQKLLLMMLASHHNDKTGLCNPSIKTLALECCMGPTSVKKHLLALERLGLIVKQSGNRTQSNTYKLSTSGANHGREVGRHTTKGRAAGDQGVGRGATTKQEVETVNINISKPNTYLLREQTPVDNSRLSVVQSIGERLGAALTIKSPPTPRTPFR